MQIFTIYETGERLVISPGRWNSAPDGYRARPLYWTYAPDGSLPVDLHAGEWDTIESSELPADLAERAARNFAEADRLTRPWAY